MELKDFQYNIEQKCYENGWAIKIEFEGHLWLISVHDIETGERLASTGGTGLYGFIKALDIPFNQCPWV